MVYGNHDRLPRDGVSARHLPAAIIRPAGDERVGDPGQSRLPRRLPGRPLAQQRPVASGACVASPAGAGR